MRLKWYSLNFSLFHCLSPFVVLFLFFSPRDTSATETAYTIQVASYKDIQQAQKKFAYLKKNLNKEHLEHLRIERVGKYYTVRIGFFDRKSGAGRVLAAVQRHFPGAITMKAYMKKERIIKLYKKLSKSEDRKTTRKEAITPPDTTRKKTIPIPTPEIDPSLKGTPLKEKISTVSHLIENGKYDEAEKLLLAEITEQPKSPELNAWYGTTLLMKNLPNEALPYFTKAASLSPNVSDYHNGVGYCLLLIGRTDEAIYELNQAIRLNPQNIDALTGLGLAYVNIGKKDLAMNIYRRLETLDKDAATKLYEIIEAR